ncbi:hypothetical protein E4U54_002237 [Claviceps lovelessii]|nr:hypothetical protein E4U54_002237 [Claviceps lovelessii]
MIMTMTRIRPPLMSAFLAPTRIQKFRIVIGRLTDMIMPKAMATPIGSLMTSATRKGSVVTVLPAAMEPSPRSILLQASAALMSMSAATKCIVAAAELECRRACGKDIQGQNGSASHEHQHDPDGNHRSSACSTHLAKASDQYSGYLKSARCICRNILEKGLATTCCAEQRKNCGVVDVRSDSTDTNSTGTYTLVRTKHHHHDGPHHHHDSTLPGGTATRKGDMCFESAEGDCCSGHEAEHTVLGPMDNKPYGLRRSSDRDIEKAASPEHVSVAVDGMTCSGCGNKLERTLKAMPGVSSVRINFLLGQAEFTVDTTVNSADAVIQAAERATNFRCNRVEAENQVLDVLASGRSAVDLVEMEIPGVTGATILNKKTVRLAYNPAIIGARKLLKTIQGLSTGLTPPQVDPSASNASKRLRLQVIKTIASALLTIPVLVLAWGEPAIDERIGAMISIVFATAVQLIAVQEFYRPALGALFRDGTVEMDMLVVISITAAYTYSVVAFGFRMAGQRLEVGEIFETSTLLVTLVMFGETVAAFARTKAVKAVSLRSLQATSAVIVEDGMDREIDARLLQYDDVLKIGPHSGVATDGLVINGSSEVDESMLTGESMPVFKKEGDVVIAGTINGTGTLVARLTRLPGENTVTDIAKLVEKAQESKPRIQNYADEVAGWFVPVVSSIAMLVVIVWLIVGFKVRHYSAGKSVSNAITYAVAVLAVACPCALSLAVPMVLVIAGGIAARNGVIIKSAECTERARKVTDIIFDKTGTITEEHLDVIEEIFLINQHEATSISKALVAGNKHPVSLAVAKHLDQYPSDAETTLDKVHVIPGSGVEAMLGLATVRAGNPKWTKTVSHKVVGRLQDDGMTILVVTCDSEPIAVYGLRTRLRKEASRVIRQLIRRQITVHLVSGDQKQAVEMAAAQVGIQRAAWQCTPSGKSDYVANLMAEDKMVMFVGDGTNDAVAVTQANIGVQLGSVLSASEVTRGAADVVLLNGLEGILFLIDISGVSFRRMVFNFMWSAVYNTGAIALTSGALVKVRIPPAYAGLGEIISVGPVIVAAMTMLLKRIKTSPDGA